MLRKSHPRRRPNTHSTGGVLFSLYRSELTVQSINRDRYTTSSQSPNTHHIGTGSILDQGRRDVCKHIIIKTKTRTIFNHSKSNHIITVLPTYYIFMYIISAKTCNVLYCWYNLCMYLVTYFICVCFKEISVCAPWRRWNNNAETCRSYVKDCTHKL